MFFLLTFYNFKILGGGGGHVPPPPTLRSLENTHIKTDTQESEGCGKFGLHKLEKCLRCMHHWQGRWSYL